LLGAGLGVKVLIGEVSWLGPSGDHWLEGAIEFIFYHEARVVLVAETKGDVESFIFIRYIMLCDFEGCLIKILQLDLGCDFCGWGLHG